MSLRTCVLVLTSALLVPACDDDGGTGNARVDQILKLDGDPAAGRQTFVAVCGVSTCHGADGNTPGTPETATLSSQIPGMTEAEIATVMVEGKGTMPSQEHLDNQALADVLAFVLENF